MNGFSNHYQLDESTFIFRDVRSDFYFLFNFSMKFLSANRIAPDGTPCSAASHLGLYCLPMSNKKDVRLIWVIEKTDSDHLYSFVFPLQIVQPLFLKLVTVQACLCQTWTRGYKTFFKLSSAEHEISI